MYRPPSECTSPGDLYERACAYFGPRMVQVCADRPFRPPPREWAAATLVKPAAAGAAAAAVAANGWPDCLTWAVERLGSFYFEVEIAKRPAFAERPSAGPAPRDSTAQPVLSASASATAEAAMLLEELGPVPDRERHADECVAIGAAILPRQCCLERPHTRTTSFGLLPCGCQPGKPAACSMAILRCSRLTQVVVDAAARRRHQAWFRPVS